MLEIFDREVEFRTEFISDRNCLSDFSSDRSLLISDQLFDRIFFRSSFPSDFCPFSDQILSFLIKISDRNPIGISGWAVEFSTCNVVYVERFIIQCGTQKVEISLSLRSAGLLPSPKF